MEERKSGKKTRGIIIAAMLVLLLAIGCLCGITFAKYVTEKKVTAQSATVAKWGFVISVDTTKLFSNGYKNGVQLGKESEGIDVKADNAVVAPGTGGSLTAKVTGTAEVDAKLTIAADNIDALKEVSLTKDGNVVHAPVVWTLEKKIDDKGFQKVESNKAGTKLDGTLKMALQTAAEIEAAIKAGETSMTELKLSWKWLFEADTTGITDEAEIAAKKAEFDKYDTLLGYAANGAGEYDNNIKVEVAGDVITVTDTKGTAEDTADDEVYTAVTTVSFGFSVRVEQTQNKAA